MVSRKGSNILPIVLIGGVAAGGIYYLVKKVQGACIDGQTRDGQLCYDGTTVYGEECIGSSWVDTGLTCPEEPLDGALRNPVQCLDGSTIFGEIYSRTYHAWLQNNVECPPEAVCTEGEYDIPQFCSVDGSTIYLKKCVNNTWVDSGQVCPAVVCNEGVMKDPFECWNGVTYYASICHDNAWIPSGEICPESPSGMVSISGNSVLDSVGNTIYTGASFTAALTYALAIGDTVVNLPAGLYSVASSVPIKSGTHIVGTGSSNTGGTVLSFPNTSSGKYGLYASNADDVWAQNLRITNNGCLQFWSNDGLSHGGHKVSNVIIADTTSSVPMQFALYVANQSEISDVLFENCYALGGASTGFELAGDKPNIAEPSSTGCRVLGGWIRNVTFNNCSAQGLSYNGFLLNMGANVQTINLTNCTSSGNLNNGFAFSAHPYSLVVTLQGCMANNNTQYGYMCRNEAGVHETHFLNSTGSGNGLGLDSNNCIANQTML